jgi:DNA-binding response OmpR family regulator
VIHEMLIIEDEVSLLNTISEYFGQENFLCEGVTPYQEGMVKIDDFQYDCIILDINLPGGSGLQLLKYLRDHKNKDAVIIISARNSLDDKVLGLDLGADDYLTKPFHLSELNARVKALIRRKYTEGTSVLELGNLKADLLLKTAFCNGQQVSLTKNEYDLLLFLLTNQNFQVNESSKFLQNLLIALDTLKMITANA